MTISDTYYLVEQLYYAYPMGYPLHTYLDTMHSRSFKIPYTPVLDTMHECSYTIPYTHVSDWIPCTAVHIGYPTCFNMMGYHTHTI